MSKKAVEIPSYMEADSVEKLTGSKTLITTFEEIVQKCTLSRTVLQEDYLFCRRFVFMQILYR